MERIASAVDAAIITARIQHNCTMPATPMIDDELFESMCLVGLGKIMGFVRGDADGLLLTLATMVRSTHGVELSWKRICEAEARLAQNRASDRRDNNALMQDLMALMHDTHCLLVAAHAFWNGVREAVRRMKGQLPEGKALLSMSAPKLAETARDHFEHLHERIREGRQKKKKSAKMPKDVFRQAPGQVRQGVLHCGTETFDLKEIAVAVLKASATLGAALHKKLRWEPKLTVGKAST